MSEALLTEVRGGVLEITLNRPDQLNAFTVEMHRLIRTAFERAKEDSAIRAVVLTGAGRGFCAGQDLSERDPGKGEIVDLKVTLSTNYNPLIRAIRSLEKPVICAVNGVAAGAGANLALACDIVLAAESARFIQAFAKIGLIPDAGGTWSLTRLVGEARAKALAMTAMPLSAKQAEEWGLIFKCVANETLMGEARTLAEDLAAGATLGIGKTKLAIQAASTNTLDEQLELEAETQGELGRSEDFREGVNAFLEKRPANFQGR
ncbi:2-(1,2-epoxy-1,2-dihydrophenyl)acetyl-CoA isomerase PaaG [Salaquimonas pukyongi]|uniref:2-(1,2-epoxy-1,2-dihydrophenyl)acetyl-CoA isomerase PaaG n=1 Tax=Salaquimonas pukyongi TaxID=2712698 RepID=UPI00096B882F|nr:2-(1,2-epoxy-1,2-dihydrophenyl)acetyl-CoA isomerase PaaG [Salaquimonas pukyongi]